MGKNKEKDKDTDKDNDKDKQIESCGKCHTYEMVKDEIQGLRRNGQRQTQSNRKRQRRSN